MKSNLARITGKVLFVLAGFCFINSLATLLKEVTFWPFFLVLSLLFALLGYLHLYAKINRENKFVKASIWTFHSLSGLLILSFIIVQILIIGAGNKKDAEVPDYVVILGAGLRGEIPSLNLVQRLDASLELIELLPEDVQIVVSGGQGPGETMPEAEAMKKYLVDKGVSQNRIIKEDKSTSTEENMIYTRKTLREIDSRENIKITIVTSNFHMYRSKILAADTGFQEAQGWSAPIAFGLIPTYYVREYMAVVKTLLLD